MTDAKKTTTINTTLREARKRCGISLAEAAEHVGITQASFSRMETGEARVTTDRLVALAAFYGYSVAGLLDEKFLVEPTSMDMNRIYAIVVLVQDTIRSQRIKPSSEKVANAVTEVYQREIDMVIRSGDANADFDPDEHLDFVEKYFQR